MKRNAIKGMEPIYHGGVRMLRGGKIELLLPREVGGNL